MKKRFGFTLAEVLITLGIIGVVAAMTIPTLIQNTSSTKFASQFKKSLSTLNQAGEMAQARFDVDFSSLDKACKNTTDTVGVDIETLDPDAAGITTGTGNNTTTVSPVNNSICALFNSTLAGTHRVTTNIPAYDAKDTGMANSTSGNGARGVIIYALADGSWVGVNGDMKNCALPTGQTLNQALKAGQGANTYTEGAIDNCRGFIDVNGAALPNKGPQCSGSAQNLRDLDAACVVRTNATDTRDVYPVIFHDGVVEPASNAARAVLSRGK